MTAEQRVQAAFDFRPTDRIPRFDVFLPGYEERWRRRHPEWDGKDIFDQYSKIDIGIVYPDQYGPFFSSRRVVRDDGDAWVERDGWGRLLSRRRSATFEQVLEVALPVKSGLDRLRFPAPAEPGRLDELADLSRRFGDRFCRLSGTLGLFMGSYRLRGEEQLLMDLVEDPRFARELAERLVDYIVPVGLQVAREMDAMRTAFWVYDELASRAAPLLSPRCFEQIYLEPYRRAIAAWRRAGIPHVVLHCDGNSMPLLELLAAAGFDGLVPVAPSTGMWLPDIRKRWGRSFVLIGGMCNVATLPRGTRGEIAAQARAIVEAGREGGVIIGSHSIDEDIPEESYDSYDALLEECGQYSQTTAW